MNAKRESRKGKSFSPSLSNRNESSDATVHIDEHSLVQEPRDDSVGDGVDLSVLERSDDGEIGIHEGLLEGDGDSSLLGLSGEDLGGGGKERKGERRREKRERKERDASKVSSTFSLPSRLKGRDRAGEAGAHPALHNSPNLEPPLRVLQLDIRVVQRPNDSIDGSVQVDEQPVRSQSLDGSLHDLSDDDFRDLHELLLEDGGLEGELDETVEGSHSDDSSFVGRADLEGSSGSGEGSGVLVGELRDLRKHVRGRAGGGKVSDEKGEGKGGGRGRERRDSTRKTHVNVSPHSIIHINHQPPLTLNPHNRNPLEDRPDLSELLHALRSTPLRRTLLSQRKDVRKQTQPEPLGLIRRTRGQVRDPSLDLLSDLVRVCDVVSLLRRDVEGVDGSVEEAEEFEVET